MLPPALALLLVFLLPALEASAFVGFIIPGEIGVILGACWPINTSFRCGRRWSRASRGR